MVEQAAEMMTTPKPDIVVSDRGLLTPRNIDEAFRLATAYHRSGLLPARFNKPEMILTAMQFGLELGLKPLTALRQIAVIHGAPSIFGDLPLAMCYATGKLEWIKEWFIDEDQEKISVALKNVHRAAWGAICIVKRQGDPEVCEGSYTLDEAKTASLYSEEQAMNSHGQKYDTVWQKYTKRMLLYRARSQVLKDKFPDALSGIAISEFDFHTIPDVKEHVEEAPQIHQISPGDITRQILDTPQTEAKE